MGIAPGQAASWSLAWNSNLALTGLPRELARDVVEVAANEAIRSGLGGGTLRFDRAVYHDVDSVRIYYVILALGIVRLLVADTEGASDNVLCETVKGATSRALEWLATRAQSPTAD